MIADLLTRKFSDVGLGLNIQIEALAQSLRNLQMAIIYGCECFSIRPNGTSYRCSTVKQTLKS